jgi:hypothetical protein
MTMRGRGTSSELRAKKLSESPSEALSSPSGDPGSSELNEDESCISERGACLDVGHRLLPAIITEVTLAAPATTPKPDA